MSRDYAIGKANPAAVFIAIDNHQHFAFCAGRNLARLGHYERTAIRLGQADALLLNDKEPLDTGRVAVFVMNSHNRSAELERAREYLNLIGSGVKLKEFLGEGTDGGASRMPT